MGTEVVNRQRLARIDSGRLANLADAMLRSLGRPNDRIAVAVVRDRAMRSLNRKYRLSDRATDVLSFPLCDEPFDDRASAGADSDRYIGDIAISIDTAMRQAKSARHSLQREVDELLMHGVLHLCGYDHETDSGEMNRIELALRKKLLD